MNTTIYDIASASGVSIATVSRVLNKNAKVNEKTRERVLRVAQKMGYQPKAFARGLANRKTKILSVVVPVISNYFFMEVLAGMQDKLVEYDYDLIIYNIRSDRDVMEQIKHAVTKGISEGYIFISIHLSQKEWDEIAELEVPIVLVDEYDQRFDSVSVDSIEGSYSATRHFVEQGFSEIALLAARRDAKPIRDRVLGYKRALEDRGIPVREDLMLFAEDDNRDGFTEKTGYEAIQRLYEEDRLPQACICTSDVQAMGAQKAMEDFGIHVPMISFDDIEIAEYCGLSTMQQPLNEMGALSIERMISRLQNPDTQVKHTVFSPKLILRKTSEPQSSLV